MQLIQNFLKKKAAYVDGRSGRRAQLFQGVVPVVHFISSYQLPLSDSETRVMPVSDYSHCSQQLSKVSHDQARARVDSE